MGITKGLATAIYYVPELARAKDWYARAFGQQPYFDEPFYVGFNVGGYELGLDPNVTRERAGAKPVTQRLGGSSPSTPLTREF